VGEAWRGPLTSIRYPWHVCCKANKAKQSHNTPWRRKGERRYSSYSFITSALDGGEWSASLPGCALSPGERTPGTHWTVGWMGLRVGLYTEVRENILFACAGDRISIYRSSSPWPGTILAELPRHLESTGNKFSLSTFYYSCFIFGGSRVQISTLRSSILTGFQWFCSVSPDKRRDSTLN
jgi:hypothetical protein